MVSRISSCDPGVWNRRPAVLETMFWALLDSSSRMCSEATEFGRFLRRFRRFVSQIPSGVGA